MKIGRLLRVCILVAAAACVGAQTGCNDTKVQADADGKPLFNGRSLAGWKVLKEGYFDMPGKVHVKNGLIYLEAGHELTGIAWAGELPKTRYGISLEAMRVSGGDFFCGMTFPVGKGHCTLIMGGWAGTVVGISNIDGLAAVENETTQAVEFQNGQWYHIELEVTPTRILVWLDGEELIEVTRVNERRFEVWPQMEPTRPFGLSSYATRAIYRNIRLTRLD